MLPHIANKPGLAISKGGNSKRGYLKHCNIHLYATFELSYSSLLQFCAGTGGWLAEILSAEEQSSINQILQHGKRYWIGLTDSGVEGQFVWQHSSRPLDWADWSAGNPDNTNNQDCVNVGHGPDFKWDDDNCYDNYALYALCQFY